jgi:hypothetical protein
MATSCHDIGVTGGKGPRRLIPVDAAVAPPMINGTFCTPARAPETLWRFQGARGI